MITKFLNGPIHKEKNNWKLYGKLLREGTEIEIKVANKWWIGSIEICENDKKFIFCSSEDHFKYPILEGIQVRTQQFN